MTERERLIELLIQGGRQPCGIGDPWEENHCKGCEYEHEKDCRLIMMADYLLANGVIVPMCKIGDTVYQTDGVRIYELEILDVSLRRNKPYYETESIDFDGDAIGKTIFLTKEEAEKALAERSDR